jgi:SAM-dependent methyltransferase
MTVDVIDLRNFYSTRLGIVARRLINHGIRARWPDALGQRVLGVGYCTPYLGLFREDAERCLAFMPAAQGVLKWPTAKPALAALVDEFDLPLPDASIDRLLLVHALEVSDDPAELLREMWRVLTPSGRMIAVRLWPSIFAFADDEPAARDVVHARRLERGVAHAADSFGLVPAVGDGVGAVRRGDRLAIRRRSHRRGDQAGVPAGRSAARASQAHPGDGAGAGADDVAARQKLSREAVRSRLNSQESKGAVSRQPSRNRRSAECRRLRGVGHDGDGGGDAESDLRCVHCARRLRSWDLAAVGRR